MTTSSKGLWGWVVIGTTAILDYIVAYVLQDNTMLNTIADLLAYVSTPFALSIAQIVGLLHLLTFWHLLCIYWDNYCYLMLKITGQLENCKFQPRKESKKGRKKRPAKLHREMLDSLVQLKF